MDDNFSTCGYATGITAGPDGTPGISVHVDELTADDARQVAGGIERLADQLTPGSPQAHCTLETVASAVGATLDQVAAVTGVDLVAPTHADERRVAAWLGWNLGKPLSEWVPPHAR